MTIVEGDTVRKTTAQDAAQAAEVQSKILSAYKEMLSFQFGGTVLLAGSVALALLACYRFGQISPPLLVLAILAGMPGAFFSALTRL
jgi:hypothetical protein